MMNPRELAAELARGGAILSLLDQELDLLVGHWEWLDARRVFYFEIHGESDTAGHLLEFHRAKVLHALGVEFYGPEGRLLAYLYPILESAGDARALQDDFEHWRSYSDGLDETIASRRAELLGSQSALQSNLSAPS